MTETTLQFIVASKILWLAVFVLLYGLGGISGKWKRRFLGSAWMMAGIALYSIIDHSWSFWYMFYFPMLVGALSLGYGADRLSDKLRKRTVYGLAIGFSPLAIVIVNHTYILWVLHIWICVLSSVILGVFNPTKSARHEESLIAAASGLVPLFII